MKAKNEKAVARSEKESEKRKLKREIERKRADDFVFAMK